MKPPLEVLGLYRAHGYTLHDAYASRAAREPRRAWMLAGGRTWSWEEFGAAFDALARSLAARGVRKGDRVGVLGRNSSGHVLMLFALSRIGAIMVPVNPEFGVEEARYVLHNAEVSAVAASRECMETARAACAGLAPAPWLVLFDGSDGDTARLDDLITHAPPASVAAEVSGDDTCLIIYTSGTTGFPKGAMHSQRSFVMAGEAFVERIHLGDDDRVMIVLPLFHMNALFYSVSGTLA